MSIRPIRKELQEIAIKELNERTERIDEDLKHLREWLEKQPHLITRLDDQWLTTFLRGCKWSLQRSKEKLDYFYTIRTLLPEIFRNRDPFDPLLQEMLGTGIICPLPNTEGINGPRIFYVDYSIIDYNTTRLEDVLKLFFMIYDILMAEDDNFVICGVKIIANFADLPTSFLLQFTPATTKKFVICGQNVYPIRIKNYIAINSPTALEKIYNNIMKPFCTKKIQNRVHLYSSHNNKKMYTHLDKSFFPEELGGDNGSRSTLIEQWKNKVESYKDWFMEEERYLSVETLRPGKPKTYGEEFDMEGTFRKLDLD